MSEGLRRHIKENRLVGCINTEEIREMALSYAEKGNRSNAFICIDEIKAAGEQVEPEFENKVLFSVLRSEAALSIIGTIACESSLLVGQKGPNIVEIVRSLEEERFEEIKVEVNRLIESEVKRIID